MIELIVEDYCQECPEFSPDINRTIARSWDDSKMVLSTTVFCAYAYRCREMEKHFKKIKRRKTMSETEIIVKMDKHLKLKGGTYVRDLVRCENCKWYVPMNNSDHGACGSITGRTVYPDDFCSEGEEA